MGTKKAKPVGYFVMSRRGHFTAEGITNNQCAVPGHPKYQYRFKLMFEGDMPLDQRAFILDHNEIDEFMQNLLLSGSCEEMQKLIEMELPDMMRERSIPLVAFRCAIIADPTAPAFLEFAWARSQKDERCLAWI